MTRINSFIFFLSVLLILASGLVDAFVLHYAPESSSSGRLARRQASPGGGNGTTPARFWLLHYNDVHAHHDEFNRYFTDCTASDRNGSYGCYGGAARQKTVIDNLRREAGVKDVPMALIDAGDQFQGTLFYTYWKKYGMNITSSIMNSLGVDTFTLGNHEFDDGISGLAPFLKGLKAKVVTSNVQSKNTEFAALFSPYSIVSSTGGKQVGVVGVTTPNTPATSSPGPDVSFDQDIVGTVQKAIDELAGKGVKCIVIASHIGYEEDQKLASQISGAQIIVGGHSHSLLLSNKSAGLSDTVVGPYPTLVKDKTGKEVYVVQALWGGKYLGVLDVQVDTSTCTITNLTGAPILLDKSITPDPELDSLVKQWRAPFDLLAAESVANLTSDLMRTDCPSTNCPIGSLVAECMRNASTVPKGAIAIVNRGGIRVDLKNGTVTRGQIMAMLPFGNSLVAVNFTGKQILDSLEVTATAPNTTNDWFSPPRTVPGAFSQIAGVRFVYDPKKETYKRVIAAQYQAADGTWSNIDPSKMYPLVTLDFLATGGDGLLKPPPALNGTQIILLSKLDEEVTNCFQKLGTIKPIIDDRICNMNVTSTCSWLSLAQGNGTAGTTTTTTTKPGSAMRISNGRIAGLAAGVVAFVMMILM